MKKPAEWMAEAILLSRKNLGNELGGPFGAIVVKDGQVVGRGYNQVTGTNDPTAHAEVMAIRDACRNLNDFSLAGCELYTSCEPCPMCLGAIYWARISVVYYANTRRDAAAIGFDDELIYTEIPKHPEKRIIPMFHFPNPNARKAFEDWHQLPGKKPY
jgi:tRNA(Arg) A34 adenosine deaminase TadA